MNKIKALFFLFLAMAVVACQDAPQTEKQNIETGDPEIEDLIKSMSLTEKVGQMTQLTLDMVCVGEPYNLEVPHRLSEEKLDSVIRVLKVGSILNCGGHTYPREYWLATINAIQQKALQNENPIPVLYGIDAIHGVNYTDSASLFPQQIGLACTWDTALVKSLATMSAYETRASGIRWNFSPVLDLARDPRWPRFWETFGEDVHLASIMGETMIHGYQGEGEIDSLHVSACLKHFLGYSITLSGKDRTPAWMPERQLREYVLPSFKAAIDAGALTIMVNSGEINGIPVHIDKTILEDLLRDELKFEGLAVTDWEDIKYLVTRHRVAKDYKSAIKMAIDAGIDMSMVPTDLEFPVLLKELVEEGAISEERINKSVRRILTVKKKLGLFDSQTPSMADYPKFASKEHQDLCLEAAEKSLVLLKNENELLPLAQNKSLLVVGELAQSLNALNGGWTHTWQNNDPSFNTPGRLSFLEALQQEYAKCSFLSSADFQKNPNIAKSYDVVIAVCGEMPYTETPGDIEDLNLDDEQQGLIQAIERISTPSILVLIQGRPRTLGSELNGVDALIYAPLPGDFGGEALSNLISGTINPSGRLAFTYPKHPSAHTCYDHKYTDQIHIDFSTNAVQPLFEFGSGISYCAIDYTNLSLDQKQLGLNDTLRYSITLTNKGDRATRETLMSFVSDSVASITPSVKRLRAFESITLEAGESKTVDVLIPVSSLAFVDANMNWIVEPGVFGLQVGPLTETFEVYE
ncbi:MAG: glycoside hydrolase family 3 N-terminal domain-containing protein [Flavobacteriales bacterium]|nr:glycoside hydrolase family 3 N-terminal domain-containing protein [Flavobacteriales bacterium]